MAQKDPAIVTDLYRISGKLTPRNTPPPAAESVIDVPPAEMTAPAVPEKTSLLDQFDSGLLKRRYGDFLRSRSDLLDRLHTMEARLASEEQDLEKRLEIIRATEAEIRQLLQEIPADDPGRDAFADRGELADVTLKIERQRIEMMRMLPIVDGASEKIRSVNGRMSGRNSLTDNELGMILDSLGTRQILRVAFAAVLPFFLAGLVCATVIALAVVGTFKRIF